MRVNYALNADLSQASDANINGLIKLLLKSGKIKYKSFKLFGTKKFRYFLNIDWVLNRDLF